MGSSTKIWEDKENYPDCILFTWVEDGQDTVTVVLQKPCKLNEAEKRALTLMEKLPQF